jgi:hypothetical protein
MASDANILQYRNGGRGIERYLLVDMVFEGGVGGHAAAPSEDLVQEAASLLAGPGLLVHLAPDADGGPADLDLDKRRFFVLDFIGSSIREEDSRVDDERLIQEEKGAELRAIVLDVEVIVAEFNGGVVPGY